MGRPRLTEEQQIESLALRFWAKVEVRGPSECWLWTAGLNSSGYGQIILSRGMGPDRAHRVSWRLHNGEIPEGLCVLHSCDTPVCVNPAHLFLGTRTDNAADKVAKGRQGAPLPRTHCPHGHEYDEENTRIRRRPNGTTYKACLSCQRSQRREYNRLYARIRRGSVDA